jgi:hypothetical protein
MDGARMAEERKVYRMLVANPEGRRPLGRQRRRRVDSIRMIILELEWGDMDWIGLAQDRNRRTALMNSALNYRAS